MKPCMSDVRGDIWVSAEDIDSGLAHSRAIVDCSKNFAREGGKKGRSQKY